ncbi:MAG: hypothetical protein U9Q68_01125 [Euryarchaeota archaeon]|nr:hypothetical protein [Euryarchaeota archaeon]
MGCNTSKSIIMIRHPPQPKHAIVLRTTLSVGALAVLLVLACAGTVAGATWVVDDDGGAGVDFCDDTGGGGCGE